MNDKLVAIIILRVYALLTILVSSLILFLFQEIGAPELPKVIMLFAIAGFLFALVFSFLKKYTATKIIVSVLPVYVLVFGSAITKSFGLYNNVLFYLLPLIVSVILLFPPILFFGLRRVKLVYLLLFINLIPLLLYGKIHIFYGVDYKKMSYDPAYFSHFIGILTFFFLVFFSAIFLLQKIQLLNVKRLKQLNNELDYEKINIKNLNKLLQYQANLYKVLAVISQKTKLSISLTRVLEELFSIDSLGMQKKGLILQKNDNGKLKIAAHKNIPDLTNFNPNQIETYLQSEGLLSKELVLHRQIDYESIPEGLTKDGHYLVLLKDNEEVIGILNLCFDSNQNITKEIKEYLFAVGEIISYRILLDNYHTEINDKNEELNTKKLILESTLSELNDSISYSYQLQKSLIPNQNTLQSFFKESYCIYLPKDKVSGDFYFIKEREKSIIFGIGDCTGHGIPGSIIAAMSIETVNQTLNDNSAAPVNEILELLRLKSKERFNINIEETRRDAMDSGICEYDKERKILYFAGGNINCVLVRNKEVSMYRGNRIPVGIYPVEKPFELKTISILEGDIVYLFSDGITDQFGSDDDLGRSKKLQRKNLYAWFLELQNHPYYTHYGLLLRKLSSWKKTMEQTDDITIFSVKF